MTCADAIVIPNDPFPITVTDDVSTLPADATSPCPSCAYDCDARFSAKWYTWTPDTSGTRSLSTFGSDYDTLLAVFSGACGALVEEACSEDDPDAPDYQSRVSLSVVADTTYYILITSYDDPGGNLELIIDEVDPGCDTAVTIAGALPLTTTVDTSAYDTIPGATGSCFSSGSGIAAAWFKWVATLTGIVNVHACESDYDTQLAVFHGECGAQVEIACGEDDCGGWGSSLGTKSKAWAVPVTLGETYLILVTGYDEGGNLVLTIEAGSEKPAYAKALKFNNASGLQIPGAAASGYPVFDFPAYAIPAAGATTLAVGTHLAVVFLEANGLTRTIVDTCPGPSVCIGFHDTIGLGADVPIYADGTHVRENDSLANPSYGNFITYYVMGIRNGYLFFHWFDGRATHPSFARPNLVVTSSIPVPVGRCVQVAVVIDHPTNSVVDTSGPPYDLDLITLGDPGSIKLYIDYVEVGSGVLPATGRYDIDVQYFGYWLGGTTIGYWDGIQQVSPRTAEVYLGTSHDSAYLAQAGNVHLQHYSFGYVLKTAAQLAALGTCPAPFSHGVFIYPGMVGPTPEDSPAITASFAGAAFGGRRPNHTFYPVIGILGAPVNSVLDCCPDPHVLPPLPPGPRTDRKGCCDTSQDRRSLEPRVGNQARPIDLQRLDWIPVCAGGGDYLEAASAVASESWD